jgi:hypothetical protein
MAQHDYVIANGTGAAVRSDLNGALSAIVSQNSGATAPTTTYAYMTWADTTAGVMKMRNGANSAWITLYQLDGEWSTIALENGTAAAPSLYFLSSGTDTGIYSPGTDQVGISTGGVVRLTTSTTAFTGTLPWLGQNGTVSAPALSFSGDTNTGIYNVGADQLGITTGGVQRVNFNAGVEVVFNDTGADVDFRIEGDTNANLFVIDAGTDEVRVANLNGGPLAGTRNRIINGDMRIDQRNAGASVTPAPDTYTLDRWYVSELTDGSISVQRVTEAPATFTNSLKVTVSTTDATLAAGQITEVKQVIEGFNTADLGFGAAGASTVTLSFWVRSSVTGTFSGSLQNGALNRSYPFSYAINLANTWEQKSITIAGDTTGTWVTNNNAGLYLVFSLGAGTTYSGTAGAWAGSDLRAVTGAVNLLATASATWQITGVQLEAGTVATPFERRSYGQELALCQRYYEIGGSSTNSIYNGYTITSTVYMYGVPFVVTKRAAPTIVTTNTFANGFPATASTVSDSSVVGMRCTRTANSSPNSGYFADSWTASAEL